MPTLPTKTKAPPPTPTNGLAAKLARVERLPHQPLWSGPCAAGKNGGITQSMIGRWLACRERFRVKYVLGLEPSDVWKSTFGFGNMWHACEESLANGGEVWDTCLIPHTQQQLLKYPMQREEIEKWYNVCRVQFPEYVKYWAEHPDVTGRTPLMQEQVFDVPYTLPSGRVARLRGKFDSVDLIDGDIWLQENKTKSEIDRVGLERQLKFDLQTMMYLIALDGETEQTESSALAGFPIKGVRYNVIRRDLPIRKHKERITKPRMGTGKNAHIVRDPGKVVPGETDEAFYQRFLDDYVRTEPEQWFCRFQSDVSERDVQKFKDEFFDPCLEQICWWYDEVVGRDLANAVHDYGYPPMNYRMPFGIYNPLYESGATEYDAYLETGSTAGLRQNDVLFTELI